MKKIVFLLLAILFNLSEMQAIDDKVVKSNIKDVTVFLQGAQIHRKGYFRINKGQTRIVFEGMTQNFDPNSIQVKGKGNFIILEVSSNVKYPEPTYTVTNTIPDHILKSIENIEDSIADLSWDMKLLDKELNAYNQEMNILLTSGVYKGLPQSDSIAALIDAMDFMRVKVKELNDLIFELEKEKNDINELNNDLYERLNILKNYNANVGLGEEPQLPVQQIIITVQSDKTLDGSLEFSYMTWNAGWSPAYDLRADDISSDTKLTYKAKVYQYTGIDWDNVNITLSSVNPNQSNYKPILAPWYVNYYSELQQVDQLQRMAEKKELAKDEELEAFSPEYFSAQGNTTTMTLADVDANHIHNYTQMTESLTNVEFELGVPYTIPADGKEHLMAVQSVEIPTKYQYYAVPKLDKDAFLLAKLTEWEDLNLLPAVANIYYDGTYVGQTRINPSVMNDTLDLALGRDREVFITRKKSKDKKEEKFLKTDVVKHYAWEISLKNNKTVPLNIIIEDQLPVTDNEDIKISLDKKDGAEHNEKSGILSWDLTLEPRKYKTIEFSYTIKHDKDQQLTMN